MGSSSALKRKLSGSTLGQGIEITQIATAGNSIHLCGDVDVAGSYDEIWLWAVNNHPTDVELTIEWGDHDHAQNIKMTIPSKRGPYLVIPGWLLTHNLEVTAFAAVTAVITIHGFVHQVSDPA